MIYIENYVLMNGVEIIVFYSENDCWKTLARNGKRDEVCRSTEYDTNNNGNQKISPWRTQI